MGRPLMNIDRSDPLAVVIVNSVHHCHRPSHGAPKPCTAYREARSAAITPNAPNAAEIFPASAAIFIRSFFKTVHLLSTYFEH